MITDGLFVEYGGGAALRIRNPRVQMAKNKKAIIADGFSVEYGGGAGI
ncbi:hypothetical protein ACE02H_06945 [Shewanella mangrovisoli]